MKLTHEKLMAGLNCGAINALQLAVLGMTWPPRSGWIRRVVGMEIPKEDYKRFLALRKQKKGKRAAKLLPSASLDLSLTPYTIEFDGGTSNNVPSRNGYGNGYGSYRLNDGEIVSVNFARPMSANVAEIRTLIAAVEAVQRISNPDTMMLRVVGDSRLALDHAQKAGGKAGYRLNPSWSPEFRAAVDDLHVALKPFAAVVAAWQPRERSVEIFGH